MTLEPRSGKRQQENIRRLGVALLLCFTIQHSDRTCLEVGVERSGNADRLEFAEHGMKRRWQRDSIPQRAGSCT